MTPSSAVQPTPKSRTFVDLEDYLAAPDFPANMLPLLEPLSRQLQLPSQINEVGVVCVDIVRAAQHLERKYKAGPFFLGAGSPDSFTDYGDPKNFETRVGFGFYKGVLIELAEPGTGSDIFRSTFDPGGKITVNHIGFYAKRDNLHWSSKDANRYFLDYMQGAGFTPRFRAVVDAFKFLGIVTVFDVAARTQGVDVEFIDFRLFTPGGPSVPFPPALCSLAARIEILLGKRVVNFPENTQT
jgi:hypothetical protein